MSDSNQTTNSRPKPNWLILVPTRFEFAMVKESLYSIQNTVIEICGFGPVVPAAKTVELIKQYEPENVLLLGIAGSYTDALKIGEAFSCSKVGCYGIGVGNGVSFQTAGQIGWNHWSGPELTIGDSIAIGSTGKELLTVCTAAENANEVQQRKRIFPNAVAEDMEGFAVAAACQICKTPVHIVRGNSNRAGDRDKSNWQIETALAAAVTLAKKIIEARN